MRSKGIRGSVAMQAGCMRFRMSAPVSSVRAAYEQGWMIVLVFCMRHPWGRKTCASRARYVSLTKAVDLQNAVSSGSPKRSPNNLDQGTRRSPRSGLPGDDQGRCLRFRRSIGNCGSRCQTCRASGSTAGLEWIRDEQNSACRLRR